MRALPRTPHGLALRLLVGAVVAAMLLVAPGTSAATAADPRIEKAAEKTAQVQGQLDQLLQRLAALESEVEDRQAELAALRAQADARTAEAASANEALGLRIRESYIRGNTDPTLALLASSSVGEALEQARVLGILAERSRADIEAATAARTRTVATASQVEVVATELESRRSEVDGVRAEVAQLLGAVQAEEQQVREVVAAEIAERERKERERREAEERARAEAAAQAAREREAEQRPSRSRQAASAASAPAAAAPAPAAPAPAPAPAPVSGGVACPVGQPRNYSDTWGAPRSGGRSHRGTDILAPRGTPIYAYESGTVTRLWNSGLGGISLYLRGDSGNIYYYTHLQGYVAGLSAGQRVSVGQQIAYNGDTGNARGIPHLHFEVQPGGGAQVNPYPYVVRACG
jgi:peptidoglycan LD-endopeptidase LytH